MEELKQTNESIPARLRWGFLQFQDSKARIAAGLFKSMTTLSVSGAALGVFTKNTFSSLAELKEVPHKAVSALQEGWNARVIASIGLPVAIAMVYQLLGKLRIEQYQHRALQGSMQQLVDKNSKQKKELEQAQQALEQKNQEYTEELATITKKHENELATLHTEIKKKDDLIYECEEEIFRLNHEIEQIHNRQFALILWPDLVYLLSKQSDGDLEPYSLSESAKACIAKVRANPRPEEQFSAMEEYTYGVAIELGKLSQHLHEKLSKDNQNVPPDSPVKNKDGSLTKNQQVLKKSAASLYKTFVKLHKLKVDLNLGRFSENSNEKQARNEKVAKEMINLIAQGCTEVKFSQNEKLNWEVINILTNFKNKIAQEGKGRSGLKYYPKKRARRNLFMENQKNPLLSNS